MLHSNVIRDTELSGYKLKVNYTTPKLLDDTVAKARFTIMFTDVYGKPNNGHNLLNLTYVHRGIRYIA